jgi:hypothetical protein
MADPVQDPNDDITSAQFQNDLWARSYNIAESEYEYRRANGEHLTWWANLASEYLQKQYGLIAQQAIEPITRFITSTTLSYNADDLDNLTLNLHRNLELDDSGSNVWNIVRFCSEWRDEFKRPLPEAVVNSVDGLIQILDIIKSDLELNGRAAFPGITYDGNARHYAEAIRQQFSHSDSAVYLCIAMEDKATELTRAISALSLVIRD